jgi:hypothetical protein
MRPFFSSGFGTFSRVLGPWSDFFPSSGGFGLDASQFGVALGTKITGGPLGATITRIIVDSPFNIAGNNAALNWRLLVLKGDINPDILKILDNDFQLATNGWPRKGGSDLSLTLLFEKIIANQRSVNQSSVTIDEPVLNFGDAGPNVASSEVMSVFIVPLFNATGVPGYGALNSSYVNFSVFGKYSRDLSVIGGDKDTLARSIPRGKIGGL